MNLRSAIPFIFVLCAPVIGYLLLPRADEQISMLVRDGKFREAAASVRLLQKSGNKDPELLVFLAKTEEASADLSGAIALMKTYVSLQPGDPSGFDYLARLQTLAGSRDGAVEAMAQQVALGPNLENVTQLAAWYRLTGRYEEEFQLLNRMRQLRIKLTVPDLVRLGEYLAAKGNRVAAISPLLDANTLLPPESERGRILLFDVLAAAGRGHEAVDISLRWLEVWRKPWIATRLLNTLPLGTSDRDIGRLAAAVLRLHPETALFVAKSLVTLGQQNVAAATILHWASDAPKLSLAEIGGLADIAGTIGDATLLWRLLPIVLEKRDSLEAQGYYLERLAYLFGDEALASVHAALPPAILDGRPLLAARIALRAGDQRLALHYLTSVRLQSLSIRNQRSWLELLESSTSEEIALRMSLNWQARGELPRELLPDLAELAGRLGYSGMQILILNELARL